MSENSSHIDLRLQSPQENDPDASYSYANRQLPPGENRNSRRLSFTEHTRAAKLSARNSSSLSPSLNRRRAPPSSPNLSFPHYSLSSPKESSRLAAYTSNSFEILDTSYPNTESSSPTPGKTTSYPSTGSKKKKKHRSNKSTNFTPPQSPTAPLRRRSLNSYAQMPLGSNGQGKRLVNGIGAYVQGNPSKGARRSLIAKATDEEYPESTISSNSRNKENVTPSDFSDISSASEPSSRLKNKQRSRSSISNVSIITEKVAAEDIKDVPSEKPSFSIWDYLQDELTASDFDSAQDLKRERVTNLLGVPGAVEKVYYIHI